MLKTATLLMMSAVALCYRLYMAPRPSDPLHYQQLSQRSQELTSKQALDTQQVRCGVQKDIWIMGSDERLHVRIQSAESHLSIMQKKGKFGAVERLAGIHCWIQEGIDRSAGVQQVRTLVAQEGTYTYPAHRFTADAVELAFYRIPGTILPCSLDAAPYLTGIARHVVLGATQNMPTFTASHLRAKFTPELPCSK